MASGITRVTELKPATGLALLLKAGECKLGCGRKLATGSQTGICTTCLSNLSTWRRKGHKAREAYEQTLALRQRRLGEAEAHPKGYKAPESGRDTERRVASSKVVRDSTRKASKRHQRTLSTTAKKRIARKAANAQAEALARSKI